MVADGHDALLAPLAAYLHLLREQVEVGRIDPLQLAHAQSGRVEQLDGGEVALVGEAQRLRPRLGEREQTLGTRAVEIAGQPALELRAADRARGIRVDQLLAVQEAEEAARRRES